ncbi:ribosomal protein S12 methylthiotransferase [Duganella sp. Leaf126]|uniref:30S ribosomal protein S12 methylthiotransferase accessory factor YcaO n=1 Tax=Duganella sp. Leaf126 TaxID=1736266 RepID=UPI0006FD2FAD|nr:30S ribosomal protein S12 methylthiotransferase accessory factor YcaO [Duganella sp. Leaf126]KQQ33277.1 ribosomal protein S12 methylthiotransferase [Duganella sp. Leaf126]
MTTDFPVPAKDLRLDDDLAHAATITRLQATLAARGLTLEESALQHPVPGVWSLRVQDRDCPLLFANGKGATELAARASAYSAFAARLATRYFWAYYHLGAERANAPVVHDVREKWFVPGAGNAWPVDLLNPALHALYNPDGDIPASALVDLNSGHAARGICALPYTRLRDGATTWFPVNIIDNLYVSNGVASGQTLTAARVQALTDIVERAIKSRIIAEGLCLPDVPDDVLARFPRLGAGIAALRAAGFGVLVKDASLGGKYPVMNVTLVHRGDQGVLSAYGAHPRMEIALERALTGLLQGRPLAALAGLPPPGFDMTEIHSVVNLESHFIDSSGVVSWNFFSDTYDYPFVDWHFSTGAVSDEQWLVETLQAEGHDIYVADFDEQGVSVCRVVVPGFSEIYPIDDLAWENNSAGNALRPLLARLHQLSVQECTSLLAALQTSTFSDERPVWQILGLAVAAGTPWKQLRIGELKTLLALVVGDEEAILAGCDWIGHYRDLPAQRLLVYRCIETILKLDEPENYRQSLALLYGESTLALAEALLDGAERFFGLDPLGPNFEGSALHQSLLAAYDKLAQL